EWAAGQDGERPARAEGRLPRMRYGHVQDPAAVPKISPHTQHVSRPPAVPGASSFHPSRPVPLVRIPERQARGARVLTVVSDELDLGVLAARRAHRIDVML